MKLLGIVFVITGILAVNSGYAGNRTDFSLSVAKPETGVIEKTDNGLFKKKKKKKDCDCPGSKQGKRKIAKQRRQHTTKS